MCGIVGYWPFKPELTAGPAFVRLFEESKIRGLHAFGLAQPTPDGFDIVRGFTDFDVLVGFDPRRPAIAHARYSQSGDWHVLENNQPIVVGNMALAHNGVIHMGTKTEFEAAFGVTCSVDNDSEIFLRCLEKGEKPWEFIERIEGSFAGVWLVGGELCAGRNARRPLWSVDAHGARWYASTRDIFKRAEFPLAEPREVGLFETGRGTKLEIL